MLVYKQYSLILDLPKFLIPFSTLKAQALLHLYRYTRTLLEKLNAALCGWFGAQRKTNPATALCYAIGHFSKQLPK
jgi:hypothetical protein